jgi:hypothetical protein
MIGKKFLTLAAATLLSMSIASNANQPATLETAATASAPAAGNSFDLNYWMAAFTNPEIPPISGELAFNAAHPSAWMKLVAPGSHMQTHQMFANPASYTQFMQPRFFMEFTKPENLMAWMNPASYTHMADPAMYQETMNPANYMVYLNPNTYLAALMGSQTCDPENPNQTPGWFGRGC